MNFKTYTFVFALIFAPTPLVEGAVIWNEATDGLLNSSGATEVPSIGSTLVGLNEVIGEGQVVPRPGTGNFTVSPDHFSVTIPINQQLVGLTISASADFPGDAFGGFYASASGPIDGQGHLGDWRFNSVPVVHDILIDLSIAPPLDAGTYSLKVIPLSNSPGQGGVFSYNVQIETVLIPEPSTALMLYLTSLAVALRRKRTS